jgi:hypothetical protein
MALSLGVTQCLRKPFGPATLVGAIGEGLSEAEQRRKHAAAFAAIWRPKSPASPSNQKTRQPAAIATEEWLD